MIWFDAFLKSRDLIWFDALFPWFDLIWISEIIIDAFFVSNHRFRRNQWHRWKELAESFRSVPYLSMKPYFWPLYGLILVRPENLIWNRNQIMIWFDLICARFCASWFDLIWFDDSQKFDDLIWFESKSLLRRFDLIWFEFAHPWFSMIRKVDPHPVR